MNQKTKVIILIVLVVIAIVLGIYLIKLNQPVSAPQAAVPTQQASGLPTQPIAPTTNPTPTTVTTPGQAPAQNVDGEFVSANAKQIYVKLADGKGAAINITATTPVRLEADGTVTNLSALKANAKVSVKINENFDAIEILIKK